MVFAIGVIHQHILKIKRFCNACSYHDFYHFVTLTWNQKTHIGTIQVKKWIGGNEWKSYIPDGYRGFNRYEFKERDEFKIYIYKVSDTLILRIWKDVCILSLSYIYNINFRTYKSVLSIDISIIKIKHQPYSCHYWSKFESFELIKKIKDTIRASIHGIVRPDELFQII